MTIEENLGKLQNVLQTERPAMGGAEAAEPLRVTNPVTGENTLIALRRNEWEQGRTARQALKSDLRFEYLKKPEDQIAEFIANCVFQPNERNVDNFIAAHAREPVTRICYFTVENLKVETPLEILGLTLLPVDDESLPPPEILNDPRAPAGSVVRVEVTGTDVSRMVQRARDEANHALRRMRIAFRKERGLNERQLRFRLGTTFAFDSGDAAGIYTREDVAYGLVANQYLDDDSGNSPLSITEIPHLRAAVGCC